MEGGDLAALELQKLMGRGLADHDQALLRIDYRQEARNAPFQFDMVEGTLHRSGCRSIPANSNSALYALWDSRADWEFVACTHCRPVRPEAPVVSEKRNLDVLYGLVSIVDQFGSVLRERGREYRMSAKGKKLADDLQGMLSGLDQTQRDALRVTLDSLDGLVKVIEAAKQNGSGTITPPAPLDGNHRKKEGEG